MVVEGVLDHWHGPWKLLVLVDVVKLVPHLELDLQSPNVTIADPSLRGDCLILVQIVLLLENGVKWVQFSLAGSTLMLG